jgi:hypothetical protein
MSGPTHAPIGRAITRLRKIWAELDYAQRRTLEIRTGLRFVERTRPRIARSVEDLDALYAGS